MSAKQGEVIIVSGPSGVGKGTILRELFASNEFPLVPSVSATTRLPRPGEVDGVDYDFLSREEFLRRKKRGEFLECFEVYAGGAWYGTLRETVDRALARGEWIVLEIDVKGAGEVLKVYPDARTIFILPPDAETLRRRLSGRGSESAASLETRIEQGRAEIAQSDRYQYKIVNDSLAGAVGAFRGVLKKIQEKSSHD